MNLLWLTPVHARSAIARFSALIVARLAEKGCDIRIASTEDGPMSTQRQPLFESGVSTAAALKKSDLDNRYDAVIVNFGDHYPNHAHSLAALGGPRVIGVFHDANMENFGNGARAVGFELEPAPGAGPIGQRVTATLAKACSGAVSHARFYEPNLQACDGPVATIPLAWALPEYAATSYQSADDGSIAGSELDDSTFRIVTVGNINKNKCADRVIEALSASAILRDTAHYSLVGAIDDQERERLTDLALAGNVQLTIHGALDDAELHAKLRDASIVSCLREPVLEGASASAIEAMLHGAAVLVSDAGFYADLPDDCVAKVPKATEPGDIAKVLEEIHSNPRAREDLGQRARQYAECTFSPNIYADALLGLIDDVRFTSAYGPVIASVARKLAGLGLEPSSTATETVLRSLEAMAPVGRRKAGLTPADRSEHQS